MQILISPTEPKIFAPLGQTSSLPEKYGVDFFWVANGLRYGVQRKELKDLIASVQDGRLAMELAQIRSLDRAVLIVEGKPEWSLDGKLMGRNYGREWTLAQHQGVIWSSMSQGVFYTDTKNSGETMATIERFIRWTQKAEHGSLLRRPNPQSLWGTPSNRDYQKHFYMGFPSIGEKTADRIINHGSPIVHWAVDQEELGKIIGKKKAEKIYPLLGECNGKENDNTGRSTRAATAS